MDAGSQDVQGNIVVLGGVDHQNSLEKSVVWSVVESVIVQATTAIRKTEDLKALGSELGSSKSVGEEGVERLNEKEVSEQRNSSDVSGHDELQSSKISNNLDDGNVVLVGFGEASPSSAGECDVEEPKMKVPDKERESNVIDVKCGSGEDEMGSSKVEESTVNVSEAEMNAHVINMKCGSRKGIDDNWRAEFVCRICHLSPDQSPGRKFESSSCSVSTDLIHLGCGCKAEIGVAHAHCAEAWFKLKGNRMCEICGEIAKNVTGIVDRRFMEEWNERRFSGLGVSASERSVGCWRGQPFCNFLMACLVIAFVLPWFVRVNMF